MFRLFTSLPAPLRIMVALAGTGFCGAVLVLAAAWMYLNPRLPHADSYREVRLETPLRIYTRRTPPSMTLAAATGEAAPATMPASPLLLAEFGERRVIPISIDAMPPLFIQAVLDTEDKRFHEHNGIDFITLAKSVAELVLNRGAITRGGSTITMQLARNLPDTGLSLDQTFIRKFKEMLLALKMEQELSKEEILELYLNVIPFGKRAYGAEAAARTYYGKALVELSLAELAMLAGIPQAPTAGNPVNGPERAVNRRNLVLKRMRDQGSISAEDFQRAVAAPITALVHERSPELAAPWVAEQVRQEMVDRYGTRAYTEGLEVYTSIDPRLQRAANDALRAGLHAYDRRHGYRGPERRLATTAADLPAGSISPEAYWVAQLAEAPLYRDQEPAVVSAVAEQGFSAVLRDGRRAEVPWAGLRWARRFVDVNTRGPRPQRAADVVRVGDLVRLARDGDSWQLTQLPDIQGALVAVDPMDGGVLALTGGYDFDRLQFNHALQARRQPGSGFKPFVYSAALDHGLTPASMFLDAPLVFDDENLEGVYRPKNSDGAFSGPTRLRRALYRSINLVSMRILLAVGAGNVLDYVSRFGFNTEGFPRNLQLAVGGGTIGLTPLEMATAYAVLANGGHKVEPWFTGQVLRNDGEELYAIRPMTVCPPPCPATQLAAVEPVPLGDPLAADGPLLLPGQSSGPEPLPQAPQVMDPRVAYLMNAMLRDVIQYGTGRRARVLERTDIGGKTGTTNEADVWFNGFNRDLVATVWVGFPDNRPVGENEFGSTAPLPIWIDFMREALAGQPERFWPQPEGLVAIRINRDTGEPAQAGDPDAIFELFRVENAPKVPDAGDTGDNRQLRPEQIF